MVDAADHDALLTVAVGQTVPEFYNGYAHSIVNTVRTNAVLEFHAMWAAKQHDSTLLCGLTDINVTLTWIDQCEIVGYRDKCVSETLQTVDITCRFILNHLSGHADGERRGPVSI